jgi:hypothetical protein
MIILFVFHYYTIAIVFMCLTILSSLFLIARTLYLHHRARSPDPANHPSFCAWCCGPFRALYSPGNIDQQDPYGMEFGWYPQRTNGGRISATHLRMAMMDRDFTPNDYEMLLALDEEARASEFTGIPQSQIERLPTFPAPRPSNDDKASVSNCAVCLHPKNAGEMLRSLPCLHSFHVDCIDPWLRSKPTCPVCTHKVVLPMGES